MTGKTHFRHALTLIVASACWIGNGSAQDDSAEDGLARVDGRFDVLEWKRGATAGQFERVAFLDTYVELDEDWLRNQNRGKRSFNEVTDEDVMRVSKELAEEFVDVFTEVFQEDGDFRKTDVAAAPDILLLRPALLNVDVAPDIFGSQSLFSDASRVALTLYLELYDPSTSTLIARMVDAEIEPDTGRAVVRRIIRRWARDVLSTLDRYAE